MDRGGAQDLLVLRFFFCVGWVGEGLGLGSGSGSGSGSQIIGGVRMERVLSARNVIQLYVNNFVRK